MEIRENIWKNQNLIKVLKEGGVVIVPTDTIYGMVGRAEAEATVERIYKIRKRSPDKPCIILIGSAQALENFSIVLTEEQKNEIEKYWPGPVSIVLDCEEDKFKYLHRGTNTLAFRLPEKEELRKLLLQTGPLIAPSANQEKFPPNDNVDDARKYFGDSIDLYIDGGVINGQASKIIRLKKDGSVIVVRA